MDVGGHIDKNGKAPYTEYKGTIFFLVPGVDFGYRKDAIGNQQILPNGRKKRGLRHQMLHRPLELHAQRAGSQR